MLTLHALFLGLALLSPQQPAGAPQKPVAAPAPAQAPDAARAKELEVQWQILSGQYTRAETEWTDLLRSYTSDPDKRAETLEKHPVKQYWERFDKLAKDGEARALLWLATHAEKMFAERSDILRQKQALFRKLLDEHASESWSSEIPMALALQRFWFETTGVEALLNEFAAKTKNREFAALSLSRLMAVLSGVAGQADSQKRADEVRDRILNEYPETEIAKKLAEHMPKKEVPLAVGALAPDFIAKDVDGGEIALGKLRGKAVLLDFGGFWSPASRALIAHEKELGEKLAKEPFAIVGVNTDDDPVRYRAQAKEAGISWRSVFDGGRQGTVSTRYQVKAFPTLMVLDANGTIRKLWSGVAPSEKQLDAEIDAAIQAAKDAAK